METTRPTPGPHRASTARLVVVFQGGVATELSHLAERAGWAVALHDPVSAPALDVDADTDVVVCDHHRPELGTVLATVLAGPVRWVGVLGSPRQTGPHVAALRALGVPDSDIARVHRPVGLDIGSRSPVEIAVSTFAGLLADRHGRSGGVLRQQPSSPPWTVTVGGADPVLDAELNAGLDAWNVPASGAGEQRELTVAVRDGDGRLVGGVSGWTWGTSSGMAMVWVREDARAQSWGQQLVAAFETAAAAAGARQVLVSSFTFQAPAFYQRLGYLETGRTDGLPTAGQADVHLSKALTRT